MNELAFMLTGVAVGGPRHGVKLTAGPHWNGIVRHQAPGSNMAEAGLPYLGRYKFDVAVGTWIWEEGK